LSEISLNNDGKISTTCTLCKNIQRDRTKNKANIFRKIKIEFIKKYGYSCNVCKYIYLREHLYNDFSIEHETEILSTVRHVNMGNGEYYTTKIFIELLEKYLDTDILQFDHLPENEQRETGLLSPEEIFVPKNKCVSLLSSEAAIRLETKKCQLVCIRCHISETIRREIGNSRKTNLSKLKYKYINKLKLNGCDVCGYKDENLPRFFDFDHLDPREKIECISLMTENSFYKLEDLKKETLKCRILCKHCHAIHTKRQIQEGLIGQKL
jgi:hypothetical protein